MVRVRTGGPRYAFALNDDGVLGLVPAYGVRRWPIPMGTCAPTTSSAKAMSSRRRSRLLRV